MKVLFPIQRLLYYWFMRILNTNGIRALTWGEENNKAR